MCHFFKRVVSCLECWEFKHRRNSHRERGARAREARGVRRAGTGTAEPRACEKSAARARPWPRARPGPRAVSRGGPAAPRARARRS